MAGTSKLAYAALRNALAEHMADGGSLGGFARQTGRDDSGVRRAWKRICADLGPQAS